MDTESTNSQGTTCVVPWKLRLQQQRQWCDLKLDGSPTLILACIERKAQECGWRTSHSAGTLKVITGSAQISVMTDGLQSYKFITNCYLAPVPHLIVPALFCLGGFFDSGFLVMAFIALVGCIEIQKYRSIPEIKRFKTALNEALSAECGKTFVDGTKGQATLVSFLSNSG